MKQCWKGFLPIYLLVAILVLSISAAGSKTVTALAENIPLERSVIYVIDPGHGGVDGGAISCTGAKESQINLQISLRLRDILHLLGFETVITRDLDRDLHTSGDTIASRKLSDLKERVRIVKSTRNAVLISIHQNMFSDGKYYGAQMFYNKNPDAMELAELLQNAFVDTLNIGSRRKCKPVEGIYIMEQIDCPGILAECGFLSNPHEEAKLRSEEYQKKIVCVIGSVLSSFAIKKANT